MPYGYTFIGKGTTDRRWDVVRQEVEVYQVLQPVQGSAVPVFLGSVDLSQIYFYGPARITHFLLLSWCGHELDLMSCEQEQWDAYQRTVQRIRCLGVHHGKLHWSNVLWNPQMRCVQLISLHKVKLLPKLLGKRKQAALCNMPGKRVSVT